VQVALISSTGPLEVTQSCSIARCACVISWSIAHLNRAAFNGGSPKQGGNESLGESMRRMVKET